MTGVLKTVTAAGVLDVVSRTQRVSNIANDIADGLQQAAEFFERQAAKESKMIYTCNDCGGNFNVDTPRETEWCPKCGSCDNQELTGFILLDDIEDSIDAYDEE